MSWTFAGVLVYIALQLALGVWVARRVRTEEDYLIAGRSLGPIMATFTVFATWFGAETCIGATGQAFAEGLSATSADPFGYAVCLFFMGAVFARALWRRKLTTLADLFRQQYGAGVERLSVLIMVPTSIMWAAAQIRAFGHVLGATSSLHVEVTVTLAAAVVIVYTALGGMLADAITDLVQGIVLIVGLLTLGVIAVASGDGRVLAEVPAERLALVSADASLFDTLEIWAIPILGSVVAQELVARVIAARSGGIARGAAMSASLLYFAVGLIPLGMGLIAFGQGLAIDEPDQVLIAQAGHYLPTFAYVLFAGALVSAILSTVDSALLVAGSLVAHNLVVPLSPDASERKRLLVNRVAVTAAGLIAYVLAMSAESVYALVEEASAFGTSGIFVCVVMALFTRFGGIRAASAAMASGAASYAAGNYAGLLEHPYLVSLAVSLAFYVVGAFADRGARPAGVTL